MRLILALFLTTLFACATSVKKSNTVEQKIIDQAIKAHGGKLYDNAHYSFDFRGKQYSFKHQEQRYEYTFDQSKNDQTIHSYLSNDQFIRKVNGETLSLSDRDVTRYGNSLNSVIYFALLPYRLNDPAVRKAYKGVTKIKGKAYQVVEVRFTEEKGGTDHDDVYYYWINEQTKTLDYLAYNFHVNGGGIRFRRAFNSRVVDGIRFQDYENYSAPLGTAHEKLPAMYERSELKLLSKIELENVKHIGIR